MRRISAAIIFLMVSTSAAAVDAQETLSSADLTRQIHALEPAAHSGDANAQLRLSLLYSRSSGTPTNAALANDWLHRAAEGGNVCAMTLLGYAYLEGDNVQKDAATAQMWLRRAAESGGRRAHGLLGV